MSLDGISRVISFADVVSNSTVQVVDNAVVKSSTSEAILGEIFFFSSVPDDISNLFPTVNALN